MVSWTEKQAAIQALESGGRVDPAALIDAARSPAHPCHDDFTWDVEQAASERWRDQARKLIRRCKFEVVVEEITTPVVSYVPSPDSDDTFRSLRTIRSKTATKSVLAGEIEMLHGLASRVYGIALAKQNIVGNGVVAKLGVIRDQVQELKLQISE